MASGRWDRMMNDSGSMTYGGVWMMLLIVLLLAVLLGAAIYVALKAAGSPRVASPGAPAPSPREVLDLRLARGEISPEDYRAARPLLDP